MSCFEAAIQILPSLAVELNHSCEGEILWPGSRPGGKSISAGISA